MARYTDPYSYEHGREGATPRWFVTRYKNDLTNDAALVAELGTAADHGYDPAIAGIAYSTTGTAGICNFPTRREWSSGVDCMLFRFEIEGNTAGNLTLDVSWYEACYGTTKAIESWRLIATDYGIHNGDIRQIANEGGQIFAHIDAITNPDGDAKLYLSCRSSAAIQAMGAGGGDSAGGSIIDEGVEAIGAKGWYATLARWLKIAVDSSGNLVISGWTAAAAVWAAIAATLTTITGQLVTSLADTLAIKTAIQIIDDVVNTHDSAAGTKGVLVQGKAAAGTPAAVNDGDAVSAWRSLTGAGAMFLSQGLDYTTSSVESREKPPTGGTSGTSNIAAASTALNSGTSLACVRVHVQALDTNASFVRVGLGSITLTTGIKLWPGDGWTFEIDDVAKVLAYANTANDDIDWVCESR